MPFRAVLKSLCARHEGTVRGAIFCDEEGERVEALLNDPQLEPYDLDLAGASYASVVPLLSDPDKTRLRVRLPRDEVWLQVVGEGYYVLVLARPVAGTAALAPALDEIADAIEALM